MKVYGSPAPREREYLFIDGGCLRSVVKKVSADLFGDEHAYQPLISAVAGGQFDKVFYYDAVPGRAHSETHVAYEARVQPDHDRFAQIQALDRVHVALGQIVGKDKRQKGVDVRLAVDMMTHAFRGNIYRATLFAGDSDFVPLLKALVAEGMHVTLWHPPQANAELKGAADSTRIFEFKTDYRCLTIDGKGSAFSEGASGEGFPADPRKRGVNEIITIDDISLAGCWKSDILTIWQGINLASWRLKSLHAPGSSIQSALTAFRVIHPDMRILPGTEWVVIE